MENENMIDLNSTSLNLLEKRFVEAFYSPNGIMDNLCYNNNFAEDKNKTEAVVKYVKFLKVKNDSKALAVDEALILPDIIYILSQYQEKEKWINDLKNDIYTIFFG